MIRSAELLPPERLVEHCIHLRDFNARTRSRGLVLPWALDVYERWPAVPTYATYSEFPSQSIDLRLAQVEDLGFTPRTFVPEALRDDGDDDRR